MQDQLEGKLILADCYSINNMDAERRETLVSGVRRAQESGLRNYEVKFLRRQADADFGRGAFDDARVLLDRALIQVPADDPDDQRAALLMMLGNAYSAQNQHVDAESRYRESAEVAKSRDDVEVYVDALLNLSRALLAQQKYSQVIEALRDADKALLSLPDAAWKAQRLAVIGELAHRVDVGRNETAHVTAAVTALDRAAAIARRAGDARTESHALGTLGSVAERFDERDKALGHTRVAILKAQDSNALDLLYQWQWQSARILESNGQTDLAIAAYRQAMDTFAVIRPKLSRSTALDFERSVAPLFFGMANLLLTEHDGARDLAAAQANLRQVQDTIERFRVVEIRDYFNEECVVAQEEETDLARLAESAAIVYPIIFDDRLEVLTSYRGQIRRHTAAVTRQDLTNTVSQFRRNLVSRQHQEYRRQGRDLYRWIVEPALQDIREAGIDTLVFVPDGPLRTVPPAAFFDGNRFLIEEFAVSNSLGLTLTSPQPIQRESAKVLASGLTVPVEEFTALPAVGAELDRISELYAMSEYRNQEFRVAPFSRELSAGEYSIVHIATHGQFKADYRESFLLAYDGRITMNALEETVGLRRFLNEPVELLMLSACQTAVGDERAALGLAGIALKAGARSAVATLWSISDNSTSMLVGEFYEQLKNPSMTKALALRQAQLRVLAEQQFQHPFYWSPFLLIGNWL